MKPAIQCLAGAVALACSSLSLASEFSNIYFFGDSLTDAGAFTNLVGPDANRFTNNPGTVWAENLGARYGLAVTPGFALNPATASFSVTGGNDYAIGGARVTQGPGVFGLSAPNEALGQTIAANIVPVAGQIDANLGQNGGAASPNALYAVWAGANDVFFQAGVVAAGGTAAIPGASTAIVTAAGDTATQVARLRAAGARHILVIALPDMGATPAGAQDPANTGVLLTQLSAGYNLALTQSLLLAGQRDIAYLDPRGLLADVLARPAAWGVTNTSIPACGAISSLGCGPAQQIPGSSNFLFADGVHPTVHTHRIVSEWVYSSLEAPGRMAAMPALAMGGLDGQWRAIDSRLGGQATPAGTHGLQVFVVGDYAPADFDRGTLMPAISGNGRSITVGVEKHWGAAAAGLAIGFADAGFDFDEAPGGIDYTQATLSAYGTLGLGAAYLDVVGSLATLDFDTRRPVGPLGNPASSAAEQWGIKVGGGYRLHAGALTHGPVAALLWQKVDVDPFAESGPTAMAYSGQSRESLRHRLGWQAAWKMPMAWGSLAPYARLTHEKEYREDRGSISAGQVGTPFAFSVPTGNAKDGYGLLAAGATMQYAKLAAHVGVTSTFGQSGQRQQSLAVGLSIPF